MKAIENQRIGLAEKRPFLPYLACGAALLLLYSLDVLYEASPFVTYGAVEKAMLFVLTALVVAAVIMASFGSLTEKRRVALLMAAGFVLRAGYMLYTAYTVRQHDVGAVGDAGHADYIYTIATTLKLPATNANEFYHPPLMYLLGAVVYRIASLFNGNPDFCFSAVKLIPCFASCATMIISYRLFKEFGLSGKALLFSTAVVCFHPAFIYLSASINNDMLSLFFMAAALLCAVRWHRRKNFRNIIALAFAIGLGMMTKLSAVLVAPAVAAVFIAAWIKSFRRGGTGKLTAQFSVFGAISLPLGLWYPLRNYLLFRQPLGYVLRFSDTLPIYCGNHSIVERFFSFPLVSELFGRVFGNSTIDYNLYIFTLKSALFGEWSFDGLEIPALILSAVNLVLVAVSLAAMVYVFLRGKSRGMRFAKYFLGLIWVCEIAFFIKFNISYPFGCTMDFRYIVITLVVGAAFIGLAFDLLKKNHARLASPAAAALTAVISLFSVFSALFYVCV